MQDLKSIMKNHILIEIESLLKDGYSLDASYEKAMEQFGTASEIEKDISSVFEYKNKYINILVKLCLSYLLVLVISFKFISFDFDGITLGRHMYLLLIPIYITISCIYMIKDKKADMIISRNKNLYSILCGVYIIFILSIIMFPLQLKSELGNIYLSELYSSNMRNLLLSFIKFIVISIPIGAVIPFLLKKFTKKHMIILFIIIPVISFFSALVKCILGQNVYINLYQYIGSMIGVAAGFYLKDKVKYVFKKLG